ncbi:MAG: hypothetical protein OXH29_00175 [bacterium]|nr:hypothetical protein [bacterium]
MDSAEILSGLPPVFATQDYVKVTGVRPSSASRALREMSEKGMVSKIRRNAWFNPVGKMPSEDELLIESGPVSHHWSPHIEVALEAAYGTRPRRISGLTALGMAGVPLMCGLEVSVGKSSAFDTAPFGFRARQENPDTLLLGAVQLTAHTWVSSPARAVLECAQFAHRYDRYEEHVGRMIANQVDVCQPSEVTELAARLGWRAGVRRLASLADGLAAFGVYDPGESSGDPLWFDLITSANRGDEWIYLVPMLSAGMPDAFTSGWEDEQRKVMWGMTPGELAQEIST